MNSIDLNTISMIGGGLNRPECAVAHSSGIFFAPDWTGDGGVSVLFPDGSVKRHLAKNWKELSVSHGFNEPLRPNGICLLDGGSLLIAHLGAEYGGIFSLAPDGMVSEVLTEVDGIRLPPTNFVTVDSVGRTWITVSTRKVPRSLAYRSDIADGFVVSLIDGVARVAADNLGYTNECMPHPDGKRLFVNETFARRLTSFDIRENGHLSNRKTVASLGEGIFPDGLAFDRDGCAWLTSIVSNRVLRVDNQGQVDIVLEDVDTSHLNWVEKAWQNHEMGRPHLDKAGGKLLRNVSNLAFCGEQLDQAALGCLLGDQLATLQMPVYGERPLHWTFDISPLISELRDIE